MNLWYRQRTVPDFLYYTWEIESQRDEALFGKSLGYRNQQGVIHIVARAMGEYHTRPAVHIQMIRG